MSEKRRVICQHCYRHFDYVHHLHRHGVLQHGFGYRIDPETICVVAYRPVNLQELQDRYRSWQGHGSGGSNNHCESRPNSAKVSSSMDHSTPKSRIEVGMKSAVTSRSVSCVPSGFSKKRELSHPYLEDCRVVKSKVCRPESHSRNQGEHRAEARDSVFRVASVSEQAVNVDAPAVGVPNNLPAPALWLEKRSGPTAALGKAPANAEVVSGPSLDERIEEILQPTRTSSSPMFQPDIADTSFGSFGLSSYPLQLELEVGRCSSPPVTAEVLAPAAAEPSTTATSSLQPSVHVDGTALPISTESAVAEADEPLEMLPLGTASTTVAASHAVVLPSSL
jgi:hypothetical protein